MVGPQQQLPYSVSLLYLGYAVSWCIQAIQMLQESNWWSRMSLKWASEGKQLTCPVPVRHDIKLVHLE